MLPLMCDERLPADTLYLVAEEDFRFEEPYDEKMRRRGGAAEPSAAAPPPPPPHRHAAAATVEGTGLVPKATMAKVAAKRRAMKWAEKD